MGIFRCCGRSAGVIFTLTGLNMRLNKQGVTMTRIEKIVFGSALVCCASPAFATYAAYNTPAPIVGVGMGAVVLVGMGYRAIKGRIGK